MKVECASAQRALLSGLDMRAVTEAQIKNITQRQFLPNVAANNPEYNDIFKEIKINIIDNARPTARAKYENGQRTIDFNTGVAFLVLLYSEYSLLRNHYRDRVNARCEEYINFLVDRYRNSENFKSIDFNDESLTAAHFCGAEHLRSDEYIRKYISHLDNDRYLSAVIGFMLGHEYGHHLLGHLPPRQMPAADYRKIESEADNFGSNLLGNYASRANATLIFDFLAKQRRSDPFAVERKYPAEECRFLYLMGEDQRFWGGFQGYELFKYLDDHIEIKERIPRILEFVEDQKNGKLIETKCNKNLSDSPSKSAVQKEGGKYNSSKCWSENVRLNEEYEEKYLEIADLSNTIPDREKRKAAACPKFRDLVSLLKTMRSVGKECITNTSAQIMLEKTNQLQALQASFEKIVAQCP